MVLQSATCTTPLLKASRISDLAVYVSSGALRILNPHLRLRLQRDGPAPGRALAAFAATHRRNFSSAVDERCAGVLFETHMMDEPQ